MLLARAQGATEYLVLLAVVLMVALVSVVLLGFFPGTASDAQITQSKAYWNGASPIAIVETDARYRGSDNAEPYIRIRNTGAYPIRITKVLAANNNSVSMIYNGTNHTDMSAYYYMAPGEEKYFSGYVGLVRDVRLFSGAGPSTQSLLYGVSSVCGSEDPWGTVIVKDFGFEYVEYIEGQQVTKREVGAKPLIIKCSRSYW